MRVSVARRAAWLGRASGSGESSECGRGNAVGLTSILDGRQFFWLYDLYIEDQGQTDRVTTLAGLSAAAGLNRATQHASPS